MSWKGPGFLLVAWMIHDVEEAVAFPEFAARLADRTGYEGTRMAERQSWTAIGLMGVLVGAACARGATSHGESKLYRAVAAGLEAHVATHIGASIVQRGYTPGVVTALPVMLPGALAARRELSQQGLGLTSADTARGVALLLPAAAACHVLARRLL